jgi:hypothetical protein
MHHLVEAAMHAYAVRAVVGDGTVVYAVNA